MNHNNGALSARLSVSRSEYVSGEDIVVSLSLRNTSRNQLTINGRCGVRSFPSGSEKGTWEVDFVVMHEQQPCPRSFIIIERRPVNSGNFVVLDAGSEYTCEYTITTHFVMDQPGHYDIQGVYQNGHGGQEYGLTAWTGEVVSNRITVRIVR